MTLEEAKKWYVSFLEVVQKEGFSLENPYAMGLVQQLNPIPQNPNLDTAPEVKEAIQKIDAMTSYAFIEQEEDGSYKVPPQGNERCADWIKDNMQDPTKISDEQILKLANLAQENKLILQNPEAESENMRTWKYFKVNEDGTCGLSPRIKGLRGPLEETELVNAGYDAETAKSIATYREMFRTVKNERGYLLVGVLGGSITRDREATKDAYTYEMFKKDLQELGHLPTELEICAMGTKHPEWLASEERRKEVSQLATIMTVPDEYRTEEECEKIIQTPVVGKECGYLASALIKKFNPHKDEEGNRIITMDLDAIMKSGKVKKMDGTPFATEDSYEFLSQVTNATLTGKACLIEEKVGNSTIEKAYVREGDFGLSAAIRTKDYQQRLSYLNDRFAMVSSKSKNPAVQQLREMLQKVEKEYRGANMQHMASNQFFGDTRRLQEKANELLTFYSNKKELTVQEQKQLLVVSRLTLMRKNAGDERYSADDTIHEMLAEKLAGNLAMDFIANRRLIEDEDGNAMLSHEVGHQLLTNSFAMQEFTEQLLKSDAFAKIIKNQSKENLEKMLKTPGKEFTKAFLTLEKNPYAPSNQKMQPTSTHTSYGGITVDGRTREQILKNAASEFVHFEKTRDDQYRMTATYPEKTIVNGKTYEFRKNMNLLLKNFAKFSLDENGMISRERLDKVYNEIGRFSMYPKTGENFADFFEISGKDKESFVSFINQYVEDAMDVALGGFYTEMRNLLDYQRNLQLLENMQPKDLLLEQSLQDSYRDFERGIEDIHQIAEMDAGKELRIFAHMDCGASTSFNRYMQEGVNEYAKSIGKETLQFQKEDISFEQMEDDPAHNRYRAFEAHSCSTFTIPWDDGSTRLISCETTAPPAGKLLFRDEKGVTATGFYKNKEELHQFHTEKNMVEILDEAKYEKIAQMEMAKEGQIPKQELVKGSYTMSIASRTELRSTSHSYQTLMERLQSSDIDSAVIRSKPQFRKARRTLEALGQVKEEEARASLMEMLQKDAKEYLDYKDPKGDPTKNKDISRYAQNRINFMRDVYEYASVQVNKRKDLLKALAERFVNVSAEKLIKDDVGTKEKVAENLTEPNQYAKSVKEMQESEVFKSITRGKTNKELQYMRSASKEQLLKEITKDAPTKQTEKKGLEKGRAMGK